MEFNGTEYNPKHFDRRIKGEDWLEPTIEEKKPLITLYNLRLFILIFMTFVVGIAWGYVWRVLQGG